MILDAFRRAPIYNNEHQEVQDVDHRIVATIN